MSKLFKNSGVAFAFLLIIGAFCMAALPVGSVRIPIYTDGSYRGIDGNHYTLTNLHVTTDATASNQVVNYETMTNYVATNSPAASGDASTNSLSQYWNANGTNYFGWISLGGVATNGWPSGGVSGDVITNNYSGAVHFGNTFIADQYIRGSLFWIYNSATVLCPGNTNIDTKATALAIDSDANRLSELRCSAISLGASNDVSTVKAWINGYTGVGKFDGLTLGTSNITSWADIGGGGGGDVYKANNQTFTGTNTFNARVDGTGINALTNGFASQAYAQSLTNGYATQAYAQALTNGYASQAYAQSLTNGYASQSYAQGLTNGYASQSWVTGNVYTTIGGGASQTTTTNGQTITITPTAGGGGLVPTTAVMVWTNYDNVGSTDGAVVRYSAMPTNTGSAFWSYTTNDANAMVVTVISNGVYFIGATHGGAASSCHVGIGLNSGSYGSTVGVNLRWPYRVAFGPGNASLCYASWSGVLNSNDTIRIHQDAGGPAATPAQESFEIRRLY